MIISVEGHADYSKSGKDIVCAGISTLAYTLLNCLLDEEASNNIKFIKKIIRDGYMYMEIKIYDFSDVKIKGIINAILTGFLMLEESYPENIRVV